jgi:plasmid stabilization system protein ParE
MAKPKKARVLLTDRAIADLREIESYSMDKWGAAQASKYLDAFDRLFRLVETEPGILSPIPVVDALLVHSVGSHVVVCTQWNGDILVLTIVHQGTHTRPCDPANQMIFSPSAEFSDLNVLHVVTQSGAQNSKCLEQIAKEFHR